MRLAGWQTRWFVLADDGTLSYYNTKEDMGQGCKGSMKVSACEIIGKTPKNAHAGRPCPMEGIFAAKNRFSSKVVL